jgi:hypothetical protein
MTFTGDVLIKYDQVSQEIDIEYVNGQPLMTDGFESCLLLAIFGKPNILNGMMIDANEKYTSTFPDVINRASVTDATKEDGTKAIEKALEFMTATKMASKITVQGYILSAYAIGWTIEIEAPSGDVKYAVNWERGALTAGYVR